MSLYNQFKNSIDDLFNFDDEVVKLCNVIEGIFKGYVPIDTEQLRSTIKCYYLKENNQYKIIIEIQNKELVYDKQSINSIKLAMILEKGQGKRGFLKRTRDNLYAKAGEKTANWIEKAYQEALKL